MRGLYFLLGILSFIVGIVGVFTPLLPTTPFLILAAFCFSRSSQKFHHWLIQHPKLGPPIRDWNESGSISKKVKFLAIGMLSLSGTYISFKPHIPFDLKVMTILSLFAIALYIFTRPSTGRKS